MTIINIRIDQALMYKSLMDEAIEVIAKIPDGIWRYEFIRPLKVAILRMTAHTLGVTIEKYSPTPIGPDTKGHPVDYQIAVPFPTMPLNVERAVLLMSSLRSASSIVNSIPEVLKSTIPVRQPLADELDGSAYIIQEEIQRSSQCLSH